MRRWTQRAVPWIGGGFIAVIVALAGFDIIHSYEAAVVNTGRTLDAQARILAEQTARSIQAVDVVLRHIAQEHRRGALSGLGTDHLHAYLREQAVGLVQVDGLIVVQANGAPLAASVVHPLPAGLPKVAHFAMFKALSESRAPALAIDTAVRSDADGQWVFPLGRRLETASGEFAGVIAARGRIDYFERFYRNVQLDADTSVNLMGEGGVLLARHPRVESALGQRYALYDEIRALQVAGVHEATRTVSPVDGVERFASLKLVPDYPLAVVVARDADAALAPWRRQSLGTAMRTLALSALAALLLFVAMRQLARMQRVRESLEVSQERYALAVAGSDDGIWDFDFLNRRVFNSARARELAGLPPGPETLPMDQWFAELPIHPEDAPRRLAAMEAHLSGRTPAYEGEFRLRQPDGRYRWIRIHGLCLRDARGRPYRMAGSISDVDARKRAEEALRLSEERFALAVAGSNDGIMDWDIPNDRMYTSERALEILNIDSTETVRTRDQLHALLTYHPEDAPRVRADMDRLLDGRSELRDDEYRIALGDGRYRWIRYRHKCVRDAAGRTVRIAGSVSDIDAQKRVEEALRSSEAQYRAVFNSAAEALVLRNAEARVIDVNPAFVELTGFAREEIVGNAGWTFAGPDEREAAWRVHRRVIEGESLHFEVQMRRRDGSLIDLDVRAVPIHHLGRPHTLAMARDITEQKRSAAALRASEERYQLAVAGSNQGLWDWDLASDTMFVSARAQEFMGLEPGEPLRPRREWISLSAYHPDDIDGVRAAFSDHLRGETAHFAVEYRLRHRSGEWHWYRQRGLALRGADGRPYRMAGSFEDITAQKDLEAQLLQGKKLEAIGTLAGGIAHDFNNILAAILGYGEMAQKSAGEGTPLRRHVDAVVSAGLRAKSLVERILAFSRSGIAERKRVHVRTVVDEALDLVVAAAPKHVRLERRLQAGDAAVLGDPTQIHQVVMNLCANAAQAMKSEGTLTVSVDVVEREAFRAATSTLAAGRYVRLAVRDTGTGIPPQIVERIFDPFFTTKEVGVGTGLGLSLVHGIVTDLGGGIEVESRPGEGSLFTVYLPSGGVVSPPASEEAPLPAGSGETVLLVDDEEPLVRLGEEMLAGLGYEPVGFTSSAAALQSFRASPGRFHAVLSDESMPELTGSELAREIRKLRQDIPVVIMSGVVTPALALRAREAGAIEVLSKPLAERDVARGLAAALNPVKGAVHE